MNNAKCPNCKRVIDHFVVDDVLLTSPSQQSYKGIACLCPACRTVLGVQMNPLAIQVETVNQIAERVAALLDERE